MDRFPDDRRMRWQSIDAPEADNPTGSEVGSDHVRSDVQCEVCVRAHLFRLDTAAHPIQQDAFGQARAPSRKTNGREWTCTDATPWPLPPSGFWEFRHPRFTRFIEKVTPKG